MKKQNFCSLLYIIILLFTSSLFGYARQGFGGSLSKINRLKQASFLLNKVTFESDVSFSQKEFLYLTELKEQSFVDMNMIDSAYHNLMNKNRFTAIDIDLIENEFGKHLHFILHANWVLRKVQVRGIVFGKNDYTSLYAQQPGDVFDAMLHEESLKSMKNFLDKQGYFNHKLSDELFYAQAKKTIKAVVSITKNKRFTIKEVGFEIADAARYDEETILTITKALNHTLKEVLVDRFYSKDQIRKQTNKVRNFLKGKNFLNSRITMNRSLNNEKSECSLLFTVMLGKVKNLVFTGNELFSDAYIQEELIGLDQPGWLFSPDIITEQLLHEYYKKGYWESEIDYEPIEDGGYEFSINEGKPVFIEHIDVKDIDTQTIEETDYFWTDLLTNKVLDQTLLDTSLEKLKNFYVADGYWDFKIVEKQFVKDADSEKYSIIVLVSRGKQRFWGGLSIPKFKALEHADFFKKYELQNEQQLIPFNLNWLKEQKVSLLQHFQKEGYWYVTIQPELRVVPLEEDIKDSHDPERAKVFVDWEIDLGPQVTFGKLLLRGNTKLPFDRIIKELKFKEGDLWDKKKIELTRKRLKRLDIFKQVQLQPYQLSKNKSKKPIILTLIDDDPVELRIRAGYFLTSKNFLFRRESTPKIGASLVVKNPTNRADRFALEADFTRFERKLNTVYQQPSFLGISGMSKFSAYSNRYVHPVRIASSSSAYEADQNGFLWGLSDEYKDCYFWGLSVGNEWVRTSRVRGNLKFNPSLIDKTLPYFYIEPSLVIDKLDDRVNTTHGSFSFISFKMMVPENNGDLTARLMLEQSLFYPITEDVVVALRARFGHILRRKFENIMPIERFYLGGPYSVRGYEKDALPPLGVLDRVDEDGKVVREYTIQGGGSMLNGNLELRFPLFKKIGAVLFQDVGVLSQSGIAGFGNRESWYPASGCGLRYKTPIGAFRFDIGWKWQKRLEGDSPYAWYLTLGEAF